MSDKQIAFIPRYNSRLFIMPMICKHNFCDIVLKNVAHIVLIPILYNFQKSILLHRKAVAMSFLHNSCSHPQVQTVPSSTWDAPCPVVTPSPKRAWLGVFWFQARQQVTSQNSPPFGLLGIITTVLLHIRL